MYDNIKILYKNPIFYFLILVDTKSYKRHDWFG